MTPLLLIAALLAPAMPSLSGTWEVQTTPDVVNTCKDKLDAAVYQWVVTDNAGAIDVQVTTKTAFKNMTGTREGTRLFVMQVVDFKDGRGLAFYEVQIAADGKSFTGRRLWSQNACVAEYKATGRKL